MKSIRRHVNIRDHRQSRGRLMPKVLLAARRTIPGLLIFGCAFVSAQEFPSKAVRIVTYAPGGGTDFAALMIFVAAASGANDAGSATSSAWCRLVNSSSVKVDFGSTRYLQIAKNT